MLMFFDGLLCSNVGDWQYQVYHVSQVYSQPSLLINYHTTIYQDTKKTYLATEYLNMKELSRCNVI